MDNKCRYCEMNRETPYGTRGDALSGGYVYCFISNKKYLTVVGGANSSECKIKYCPICGKELDK